VGVTTYICHEVTWAGELVARCREPGCEEVWLRWRRCHLIVNEVAVGELGRRLDAETRAASANVQQKPYQREGRPRAKSTRHPDSPPALFDYLRSTKLAKHRMNASEPNSGYRYRPLSKRA